MHNPLQNERSNIALESQNKIYRANDVNVDQTYKNTIKNIYDTDIELANFSNRDQAADVINQWVRTMTRGLIPSIVERGDEVVFMKPLLTLSL